MDYARRYAIPQTPPLLEKFGTLGSPGVVGEGRRSPFYTALTKEVAPFLQSDAIMFLHPPRAAESKTPCDSVTRL